MRSGLSPRLRAIDGSAVLTIVESSVCMKNPTATSQSWRESATSFGIERVVYGVAPRNPLRAPQRRRRGGRRALLARRALQALDRHVDRHAQSLGGERQL